MPLKHLLACLLALFALVPAASAAPPKPGPAVLVVATPQGSHVVGRPGASLKLVEYVSYTCPHCAHFEVEGAPTISLTVIRTGKGSFEYRPFLRNVVDVAATLMVGCGSPAKFLGNHAAVLRSQAKWFVPPSESVQQRWQTGDFVARMRAVAGDMSLYPIFEARGYSRAELDRCLANEALAKSLAAENRKAMDELKLEGTPSFLINGQLQPAHDWATLQPALAAATK
ncbi:MAG TPA: thioredoxin domain-containing protein [Novosphingobium sp.]|nr:thioredoxin domain-containing protein [Novosphingobium sp.]